MDTSMLTRTATVIALLGLFALFVLSGLLPDETVRSWEAEDGDLLTLEGRVVSVRRTEGTVRMTLVAEDMVEAVFFSPERIPEDLLAPGMKVAVSGELERSDHRTTILGEHCVILP
ncbi:OB-fold nucleic acid binding domain-containing protein [Candidatus Woesearchaeota archaeon]|nr:OB-fold nucleic acid binding domain-containing protein [Candidatus Woesearchaeota archaeon]